MHEGWGFWLFIMLWQTQEGREATSSAILESHEPPGSTQRHTKRLTRVRLCTTWAQVDHCFLLRV